jgi:hypothetical protein
MPKGDGTFKIWFYDEIKLIKVITELPISNPDDEYLKVKKQTISNVTLEALELERKENIKLICKSIYGKELNTQEISENFVFFPIEIEINFENDRPVYNKNLSVFNRLWCEVEESVNILISMSIEVNAYNTLIKKIIDHEIKSNQIKSNLNNTKPINIKYIDTSIYYNLDQRGSGGNLHCLYKNIY